MSCLRGADNRRGDAESGTDEDAALDLEVAGGRP